MASVLHQLLDNSPVILDGAWGTQLQSRGLLPGQCPDAWNLTHPDDVVAVATGYVDAGSMVILTNTFGANRITLSRWGLDARAREINRLGVELSKRATGGKAFVFASIGPSGAMLLSGDVSEDDLRVAFTEQAEALSSAGADALVVETMSDPKEAVIAVAAGRQTGLPVIACMSFDSGKLRDRTMMGTTPEEAARELEGAGASVIGANCGQGIAGYLTLCGRLRSATLLPIWLKPNAGSPELVEGRAVYRETPGDFAACIPPLVKAGAQFVGGCCGTSPEFILAIREAL